MNICEIIERREKIGRSIKRIYHKADLEERIFTKEENDKLFNLYMEDLHLMREIRECYWMLIVSIKTAVQQQLNQNSYDKR